MRQPRPGQELKALPQSASKTSSALPATAAGSLAPAVLLSRLSSKQWLLQSCSSTRLVLSTLLEVAAVNSPQQQHVQQQLQRVADSVSWEAACSHCMDALVIRCADLDRLTVPV